MKLGMHLFNSLRWAPIVLMGMASASVQGAPPPIENFTKTPTIQEVSISPSGKYLALIVPGPKGFNRLGVINLEPLGTARIVASFGDADITRASWASDERIVFMASQRGLQIKLGGAGSFAVNQDGSNQRQLIAWQRANFSTGTNIQSRMLPYEWSVHSTIDDNSDDIYVSRSISDGVGDFKELQLARLNTVTGELKSLSYGMPDGTRRWLLDDNQVPRLVVAYKGGREKIYWRESADAKWQEVANFDPIQEAGFVPRFINREGEILVTARHKGDTSAVYRFDPRTRQIEPEALVSITGFDLNPVFHQDSRTNALVGLHFRTARGESYWFDEGLQRIQRSIDKALPPGRSNRLYCGRCESSRFIVVQSKSDTQPGEYFLFDREKSSLQLIGASRPWIDEATQGHRSVHQFAARDGLMLPVYVTHPPGSTADQALPAVVLVHGGPWVRGTDLAWRAEAQFLASRGYRVLEPEFRGSAGYGFRHFQAGWKQWGKAMQDDLADTVEWAGKRGLIDPSRVCIAGGSYGGYAALMGPIVHPKTYRCAASFAGVTDIELMYSVHWSDFSEDWRRYGMPVLIGDPKKDADQLARTSPLLRAAEIKVPVLLAHGGLDRRVPIEHARKFARAAQDGKVDIEVVDYLDEGHGFYDPANQADYFGRMERFFDKLLKPAR